MNNNIKEIPTVELKRFNGKAKSKTWRDGWMNLLRLCHEVMPVKSLSGFAISTALILIIFLGIMVRVAVLSTYPMDRDELARVIPPFTWNSLVPPGSLLLNKFFDKLIMDTDWGLRYLGFADWGVRFPSFLYGILGIPALFYLGKKLFGAKEGLLASLMLSVLMVQIYHSNEAKEYTALVFFSAISTIIFYSLLNNIKNISLIILLLFINLLALFFGSYFFILLFFYQIIILCLFKFIPYLKRFKEITNLLINRKKFLTFLISFLIISALLTLLIINLNNLFGIYFIMPQFTFIRDNLKDFTYFVAEDKSVDRFLKIFLVVGLLFSFYFRRYRKPFLIILSFGLLDYLFISTVRFSHRAFPITYPRYHSFLIPFYLLGAAVGISGIINLADIILKLILSLIRNKKYGFFYPLIRSLLKSALLICFAVQFLKIAWVPLSYYYTAPETVLLTNYKDAGQYLSNKMQPGDTLVRVKNFGMDHKFNHVNRYLYPPAFEKINYSIFPNRNSFTNWYVPIGTGEDDPKGFSDWLWIEKFRPTFRYDAPYVYRLAYFGPLIDTKKITNDGSWKVSTDIESSDDPFLTIDQNIQTKWSGYINTGNYFTIDLGKEYFLNGINYNFNPKFPQNLILSASVDNFNWQPVYALANAGFHPHNLSSFVFRPVDARYIRMQFILDPLSWITDISIAEIEPLIAYEYDPGLKNEDIYNAKPVFHFSFTDNNDNWTAVSDINDLKTENGVLKGIIGKDNNESFIGVTLPYNEYQKYIKNLNFRLKINKGNRAVIGLDIGGEIFWIRNYNVYPGSFASYYTIPLEKYDLSSRMEDLQKILFSPSNVAGAEFSLDFFSLDDNNLPGIQIKDNDSINGLAQYIPYRKDEDYAFFQIGNEFKLEKGEYALNLKIKADAIDQKWKEKLNPPPVYRMNEYIEANDVSTSDILYVSMESTRATFYDSPGHLNIHGEAFTKPNTYVEFNIYFKSDGKETLFLQAFSPKDRRYPADLLIAYPTIKKLN